MFQRGAGGAAAGGGGGGTTTKREEGGRAATVAAERSDRPAVAAAAGGRGAAAAAGAGASTGGGGSRRAQDPAWDVSTLRSKIVHRTDKAKFELRLPDCKELACLEYRYATEDDQVVLDLTHTTVPQAAQGHGVAGLLVTQAFEFAQKERITVRPSCSYIHTFINNNPHWKSQLEDPSAIRAGRGGGGGGGGGGGQQRNERGQGGGGGGGGKTFQKQQHYQQQQQQQQGGGNAAASSAAAASSNGNASSSAHPWQRRNQTGGGGGVAAASSLAPPAAHSVDGDTANHAGSKRRSPLRFDEDMDTDEDAAVMHAAKRGRADDGSSRKHAQLAGAAAAAASSAAAAAAPAVAAPAPAASSKPVVHIPPAHVPLPCNPQFAKRWALTLATIANALGDAPAAASSAAASATAVAAAAPSSHPRGSVAAAVDVLRRLSMSKRDLEVRCLGLQTFLEVWVEDAETRTRYLERTLPFLLRQIRAMPSTFDVLNPEHVHLRNRPYACLPTLRTDVEATLHLTKLQLLCLLSCSMFGLHVEHIPRRDSSGRELQRFRSANFDGLGLSIGRHALHARGTNDTPEEMRSDSHPEVEKMKCLFAYFEQMRARVEAAQNPDAAHHAKCARILQGIVTFHRKVLKLKRHDIELRMIGPTAVQALKVKSGQSTAAAAAAAAAANAASSAASDGASASLPLCPIDLRAGGTIEDDGYGTLQIDFANRFLGGGVLTRGCVQEEIRLTICPESLAGLLFVEVMEEHESVTIIGAERFANYSGYSSTFQFSGAHADPTPVDPVLNRLKTVLVAIDAISFRNKALQYKRELILREILKAYAGFALEDSVIGVRASAAGGNDPAEQRAIKDGALTSYLLEGETVAGVTDVPYTFQEIATGNWGCGAFGAEVPLKCMIQLLAATLSHRRIRYFTFGSETCDPLPDLLTLLQERQVTVKELYFKVLMNYHPFKQRDRSTAEYVRDLLDGTDVQKRAQQDAERERAKRLKAVQQRLFNNNQQTMVQMMKPSLARNAAPAAAASAAAAAGVTEATDLAGDADDPIEDPDADVGVDDEEEDPSMRDNETEDGYDSEAEREIAAAAEAEEEP